MKIPTFPTKMKSIILRFDQVIYFFWIIFGFEWRVELEMIQIFQKTIGLIDDSDFILEKSCDCRGGNPLNHI